MQFWKKKTMRRKIEMFLSATKKEPLKAGELQ